MSRRDISHRDSDLQIRFSHALEFHRRGELEEAERIYTFILQMDRGHFGAIYSLGVAFLQRGQFEVAERYIRRAIAIDSTSAAVHANYAVALKRLGRLEEALASFGRAIALDPAFAEAFFNRGNVQRELGQAEAAIASYDKALALKPDYVDAFNNRGNALKDLERFTEALASFTQAVALRPDAAEFWMNRGIAEVGLKRFAEAIASYDRAIRLKPDYADAFYNRGIALQELNRVEDALANFDRAIALRPDFAEALNNRGNALKEFRRLDEALASYAQALAFKSNYADALLNRGVISLTLGQMAEGWRDYEHRWRLDSMSGLRPPLDAAHWTGQDLRGRSILVYAEQGIGDCLQFSRYLPLLAERGATVCFLVPPPLLRISQGLPGNIRCLSSLASQDRFDFQCALMSLPYRCGTDVTNIPASVPYLRAQPERSAYWRDKLGSAGFKIGICWRGGLSDATRNFPLREAFRLSQIPGVRLISLHKGDGLDQLATLPAGMNIETLGDDFDAGPDAFLDTAAVMESLDLVLTADTAVAHLAGALGRTTWVVLKLVPDWRWMLDRSDSPWYPTLRLFRQSTPNDFASAFEEITAELRNSLGNG